MLKQRKMVRLPLLLFIASLPVYISAFGAGHRSDAWAADSARLTHIFKAGDDGYACFRIPAIVRTGEGTLLAFAEGRRGGCSDTGNIDLVLKRSDDGGKTWSALQIVWDDGENTCGNPAPVMDRGTGKIFLLMTWNRGSDHERDIIAGTSEDTRRVFVTSSSDDGRSWSSPRDLTRNVKRKNWTWYATGPGAGIQLTKGKYAGRMIIACDHVVAESKTGYSHVIYSDNGGKSWKLGGVSTRRQTNESSAAELSNGAVMLNMRNYDREVRHRQVIVSDDGGKSWDEGYADEALIEPICQATLISHSFPGDATHYLVFSNPSHTSRRVNMTVKVSNDDGRTWSSSRTVHPGPSAYSDMVSLPNGDVGILYEGGHQKPYEGIVFEIISAKDLLNEE